MNQKTVKDTITWEGIGLHTGVMTKVSVSPAPTGFGIKFKRTDQDTSPWIKADVKMVSSTHRSTNIKSGEVEIATIEHLLAALIATEITNAEVLVDGPEVPILDGSALPFYNQLVEVIVVQEAPAKVFNLKETVHFRDDVSGAEYIALPSEGLIIESIIEFNEKGLGQKHAKFSSDDDFGISLAGARTFVFTHEVIELANAGLIKGGNVENALVLKSKNATDLQFRDCLKALNQENPDEIIDKVNEGVTLKFDDELARHKLLDLYGDLGLLGVKINAHIIAKRPGHTGNIALANKLKNIYQDQVKYGGVPEYDPNIDPVYDTEQIKSFLPHRYPFLLVDKIIEMTENRVVGVKNVTFNENFFMGHFPGNPVFPGVLQMEALAQTGGLLALVNVENPANWDTYFLKMDNVKFKRKVNPGDTLILKMELIAPIRRGIVQMKGTTYVGKQVASEGELTAQIVDRTKIR